MPVYHNAGSLLDLVAQLRALSDRNRSYDFEFIFVDDASRDDSYRLLKQTASTDSRVRILKLSRNFGSNAAILAGFGWARGDAIVMLSADLQDPPETIDSMIAQWQTGRKVVLAVRKDRGDPFFTKVFSFLFYRLFRAFALKNMPRGGFDFFLIDRKVCNLVREMEERNTYLMGLILWLGFDPSIIEYSRQKREAKYGRSMWTWTKKIKYFIDSFVAFSYAPIRVASLIGSCLGITGGLYAMWIIYFRLTSHREAPGWASLMVVFLVVSGVQMLILGIFGEYLWRNLEESRRRPRYIVEQSYPEAEENVCQYRVKNG